MQTDHVFLVNSRFRNTGTDNDFTISVPSDIFEKQVIRAVKLLDCNIPVTWYKVNTNNNAFTLNDSVAVPIAMTAQNYDAFTMQSILQTTLNANSTLPQAYTVTFNTASSKYTITAGANFTLDFTVPNSIGEILGFGNVLLTGTNTYTSTNVVDFHIDKYIYICSNLSPGIDQGDIILQASTNPTPIDNLFAIPISVDYGYMNTFQANNNYPFVDVANSFYSTTQIAPTAARTLSFRLQLPSGTPTNLNGSSWSMKILVSFRDKNWDVVSSYRGA